MRPAAHRLPAPYALTIVDAPVIQATALRRFRHGESRDDESRIAAPGVRSNLSPPTPHRAMYEPPSGPAPVSAPCLEYGLMLFERHRSLRPRRKGPMTPSGRQSRSPTRSPSGHGPRFRDQVGRKGVRAGAIRPRRGGRDDGHQKRHGPGVMVRREWRLLVTEGLVLFPALFSIPAALLVGISRGGVGQRTTP